jgi:DNA-binding PadR family transcriptional regulator
MRKPVHDEKIIALLKEKGALNATEIGKELNIKNGFVYSVLDRMRKRGFLVRTAAKKYAVNDKPRTAATVSASKPKETTPAFDPRIEVLWGEVQSIDQRLDYLMAVKIHLVNRINEIKDATARSARSR